MLPNFRLETYFARWEFTAAFNLAASDSASLAIQDLLARGGPGALAEFLSLGLGYTQTRGHPALRSALATGYERLAAADFLVCSGAQEAIFAALHAVLRPGDHTIVLVPTYQSLETIPASFGPVTRVRLREEDGWQFDLDEVRAAIRPDTRMLIANFPNNPTGFVPDEAAFRALVALADERGIYVLVDEAYRGIERPATRMLPCCADLSARGISIGVMSKALGLPGLRIGWIATRDRAVLSAAERVKHYGSIASSAPSELLAIAALRSRREILDSNRQLASANWNRLRDCLSGFPDLFDLYEPTGGCVAYPRYLGREGAETFCRRLVEDAGVLLLPPSVFESESTALPTDRFRIGFGRHDFSAGLDKLLTYLHAGRTQRQFASSL